MATTVATFNVNGVNGRLPRLLEWLQQRKPDIVCLQELKTDDSKFPARALEQAGYGAIWHGQRAHHGVAILAKGIEPAETRRGLPGDRTDRSTRYLEAEIGGITVASVYLPNGNPVPSPNFDYKLKWFGRFIRYSRRLYASGRPVILAGDLNVVPTDFDIYRPGWWRADAVMQPEARDAFRRLIAQGWVDTARQLHPEDRMYTYWVSADAYREGKGMRLDFMLASAALQSRVNAVGVDAAHRGGDKPSDHAPMWLTIAPGRLATRRPHLR
jgi:exodeoxyribonuclease-3